MRKIFIALLLVSTTAYGNVCEQINKTKPKLEFHVNTGQPRVFEISSEKLKSLARQNNVIGLTEAKFVINYRLKAMTIEKNGSICVYLDTLVLEYGYPDMFVYVDNKYKQNTCEFTQIINHENEHVKVHQKLLLQYSPLIEQATRELIQDIKPIQIDSYDNVEKVTDRFIKQVDEDPSVTTLRENFEKERLSQNTKLDSKESYADQLAPCKNW